ncbi:glycosyltransferase family 39 protein [Crateriforma conspicua]|uniref:Glycosyltransferase RgtA/B/C/D-like domain-containing protein n=1 Tax=Crateriforma conspicua TaxID=2527996 RepID=A0A5C5YB05_9PLAN|nr:glycosyltransferase family 39 protein [Crateriforma conspicua]TWT72314.1 hypothetical protein Pan14r_46340 [Crateriforma conspicua]
MKCDPHASTIFKVVAFVIVVCHSACLGINAWRLSPTSDEYGHFYAGLRLLSDGDTSIFSVNPPLIRGMAAAPAMLAGIRSEPPVSQSLGDRPEFDAGRRLFRDDPILFQRALFGGRLLCSLFSVVGLISLLGIMRLYAGPTAALVVGCIWAFHPGIVSHGSLITNDVPVTVCMGLASASFLYWLKSTNLQTTMSLSFLFTLALLCKFSALILVPLFLAFSLATPARCLVDRATSALLVVTISMAFFCAVYGFQGMWRPLGSYAFISPGLRGEVGIDQIAGNRFLGTVAEKFLIPFPENALTGMDIQVRDFETGTPSFVAGRRGGAWWFYFYAMLVKFPMGFLIAVACAAVHCLTRAGQLGFPEIFSVTLVYMFSLVLVFTDAVGQQHRYVFPVVPFCLALVAHAYANSGCWIRRLLIFSAVLTMIEFGIAAPHWLASFNALAGGRLNGHRHLFNDATDWGQDLFRLATYSNECTDDYDVFVTSRVLSEDNLRAVGLSDSVYYAESAVSFLSGWRPDGFKSSAMDRPSLLIFSKTEVGFDPVLLELIDQGQSVKDLWGSHLSVVVDGVVTTKGPPNELSILRHDVLD